MKTKSFIQFDTYGSKSINDLDESNPKVYCGQTLINQSIYSGNSTMIMKSTTIDEDIKRKLSKAHVQYSLGYSEGKMKNAHMYSLDARYLDGIERICYLQQEGKNLVVSEYHSNRGAKYSALYKELILRLRMQGFNDIKEKFIIAKEKVDEFISVVNRLVEDRQNDLLILNVSNDVDSISIKGTKYYYYKVFWQVLSDVIENNGMLNQTASSNAVKTNMKELGEYIMKCDDLGELESIFEKIKLIEKLLQNQIENLKTSQSL
ncbi:hypothetical protein [Clostridium butyricum]|uniref:hypothetical protein n=1 Tax=Clostridium butyricum TaxID=1492 RepID=UPI003465EF1E